MILKVSHIQSLTDARYFSSKSADMLCFCFDPESEFYIEPFKAQEIIKWIEGPKLVGEFNNQSVAKIKEIATVLKLDYIQMKATQLLSTELIELVDIIEITDFYNSLDLTKYSLSYFLVNVDLDIATHSLKKFCETNPVIINIDKDYSQWLSRLQNTEAKGINISSLAESVVGEKSFDELDELFENL